MNVLRVPEPGMKLFNSTAEQIKHLIFKKPHPEWVGAKERIDPNAWFPRKVRLANLLNVKLMLTQVQGSISSTSLFQHLADDAFKIDRSIRPLRSCNYTLYKQKITIATRL